MSSAQLDATDVQFGRAGVRYPADFPAAERPRSRAFLIAPNPVASNFSDQLEILPDGKTLRLHMTVSSDQRGPDIDQMRILVKARETKETPAAEEEVQ
jgi:hypothetical protein